MAKNQKNPKIQPGFVPPAGKRPRANPISSQGLTPTWVFRIIDFDSPWCPKQLDQPTLLMIINKLGDFETMTWGDIEGPNNHSVEKYKLIKDAQQRLESINQDDVDELFSFRLNGRNRVWGIRDGQVFKLLWWDPEHQVCPSPKKHT